MPQEINKENLEAHVRKKIAEHRDSITVAEAGVDSAKSDTRLICCIVRRQELELALLHWQSTAEIFGITTD